MNMSQPRLSSNTKGGHKYFLPFPYKWEPKECSCVQVMMTSSCCRLADCKEPFPKGPPRKQLQGSAADGPLSIPAESH